MWIESLHVSETNKKTVDNDQHCVNNNAYYQIRFNAKEKVFNVNRQQKIVEYGLWNKFFLRGTLKWC